jgi:hypothetical protein
MKRETGKLDSLFPTDHREGSILKKIVAKTVNYCEFFYIEIYAFFARILQVIHVQKKKDEDLHI